MNVIQAFNTLRFGQRVCAASLQPIPLQPHKISKYSTLLFFLMPLLPFTFIFYIPLYPLPLSSQRRSSTFQPATSQSPHCRCGTAPSACPRWRHIMAQPHNVGLRQQRICPFVACISFFQQPKDIPAEWFICTWSCIYSHLFCRR